MYLNHLDEILGLRGPMTKKNCQYASITLVQVSADSLLPITIQRLGRDVVVLCKGV